MQSPSLHFLHIQAPPWCTGHLVAGRDVEAPVLVMAMASEEPAGLGPFQIPEKDMRLQRVGGRSSGFVSSCAGSRVCSFPLGILPVPGPRALLPKASRDPAVLSSHPGPGNAYVSA